MTRVQRFLVTVFRQLKGCKKRVGLSKVNLRATGKNSIVKSSEFVKGLLSKKKKKKRVHHIGFEKYYCFGISNISIFID